MEEKEAYCYETVDRRCFFTEKLLKGQKPSEK